MREYFYHLPLNPEPWAIGPLGTKRNGSRIIPFVGRNQMLHAYKEAIKEELKHIEPLPVGEYELFFYFWRNTAVWETSAGRKAHRNIADATNMQKATEDALQGILIDNDRNVKRIGACVVESGPNVLGQIIIRACSWNGLNPNELPDSAWAMFDKGSKQLDFEAAEDFFD